MGLYSWLWKLPVENGIKVLVVADPQLVGYQNEPKLGGGLRRWDSDNYMKRAYSLAYDNYKPDVVIFLGDLIDEMIFATQNELEMAIDRFYNVFPQFDLNTTLIFIPGDNDIGGEVEPVHEHLKVKFAEKFLNFYSRKPIDKLLELSSVYSLSDKQVYKLTSSQNGFPILLSHVPMIRDSTKPVFEQFNDENYDIRLILSGHDHVGEYYIQPQHEQQFDRMEASRGIKFLFKKGEENGVLEIQVPTISYRMGVPDMAIGALNIENTSKGYEVHYENLWLPPRYPQLYVYWLTFIGLILIILFKTIALGAKKWRQGRESTKYNIV
ncbi:unnamed protein product [Bursaphelenchus okinawaensis]|uniref:Calcineurin-like phosphoesterase domain-containing protein n=1 Tax=Bursaphelenchus okinawaensis TaxID=465554 RepID=A0A811KU16_9BILA|nr:unnamed protein product [Bursaphelenchus okinawaensis]CAG9110176.1 unnamed protein product [Bursaphelenchus okinawaensis]